MKLLFFIYSMHGGGAERVTANLANHWAAKEWDVTVVTLASRSLDFYALHPAVKRIALELTSDSRNFLSGLRQNIRRIRALRLVLRQIRPDIAIGMTTTANVLLAFATFGMSDLCTIGSERNYPPHQKFPFFWKVLRCHIYGLLNAIVVLTVENKEWIKNHTNAKHVVAIPNPILFPLPLLEPRINPTAFSKTERKMLLAVGRLNEQKGFDLLIGAFDKIASKYHDWDLVILGEGSLRAQLENQILKSSLDKRIFLPGLVGNLGEWYGHADLFVMSSRFEGFPNTLVEAMAYGLAVVSFDCDTGPRDIIRHEVDGLLVPLGDVTALIAALESLIADADLRKQFALRAKEAKVRFSIEKIAGMWEELFEKVLPERFLK